MFKSFMLTYYVFKLLLEYFDIVLQIRHVRAFFVTMCDYETKTESPVFIIIFINGSSKKSCSECS